MSVPNLDGGDIRRLLRHFVSVDDKILLATPEMHQNERLPPGWHELSPMLPPLSSSKQSVELSYVRAMAVLPVGDISLHLYDGRLLNEISL